MTLGMLRVCNMDSSKKEQENVRECAQGQVDQMCTSTLAILVCMGNKVIFYVPSCSALTVT